MANKYEFFKSQSFDENGAMVIGASGSRAIGTPAAPENEFDFFNKIKLTPSGKLILVK